ncbi:hypothetical protein L484_020686 [Morus notabilis]|uniref:Uncharacterized protein n=1 Tax=Morus notabilis TaxID=981085 RepID=W9QUB5_9ROSA|nr:uncharacterized protein LOC21403573 [Morus notabilis]EXB40952.1 hypothetical protein L484_020686 [Morus notabilis]
MLDIQQELDGTHLCSSSPPYKMHARRKSTGDGKFDLLGGRRSEHYESFGDHFSFSTELESQVETCDEERFGFYSPPLWRTNKCSGTTKYESFPLLPHNHHYSNLSPNSRRQVITEGRRELMEMIQNMPESCYELSLKDLVDKQHGLQEGEEENTVIKDENSNFDVPTQIRKLKKQKRTINRGQITRTGSMESETFLIKMFFPTSLGSKKKAKAGNRARVSSIKSTKQSETDTEKVQWIKGLFVVGRSKKICRSSTSGSSSSSNSSSGGRYSGESDFVPGCWPFFTCKKSKSMREKDCIFRTGN